MKAEKRMRSLYCQLSIVVVIAGTFVAQVNAQEFRNQYFEPPTRLMVGDKPLNTRAKQMYPSPAVYDVDNDGTPELIVGDIFGSLNVYEKKLGSKNGDPVWNRHVALKSISGKPIKVSNW